VVRVSEPFVASNGWEVERLGDGQCSLRKAVAGTALDARTWCGPDEYEAIAEYARAEADAELGRWRSPTHPDYVVYPSNDGYIRVFSESACYVAVYTEDAARGAHRATVFAEVAVEYFDAHKPPGDPKPWLDAEEGEIWALTGAGGVVQPWLRDGDDWVNSVVVNNRRVYPKPEGITAGHRIWPVSENHEEQS